LLDELTRRYAEQNADTTTVRTAKLVYKVEEPDDEYDEGPKRLEQVHLVDRTFLAKEMERENIIVDTGSNHNLISRSLMKQLGIKLKSAGQKLVSVPTRKFFQFGGGPPTKSTKMIKVPMNMCGKIIAMDVFVVEQNVPFLMGGKFLKDLEAKIDMKVPALLLRDGQQLVMKHLESGHLAIEWNIKIHRKPETPQVLLSEKVSRKDYDTPEVREAMDKEMKNLQEHGTYEEVRREQYMSVIPSLWVINRHTEDGKTDSGKVKSRLVVQGNLNNGIQETPSDSPTVD